MPSLSSGVTVALRLAGFEARYGAGAMGPGHLLLALSWISDESLSERFDDPDKRRELAEEGEQLRERFARAGIDPDELRGSLRAALCDHAREELLRGGVDGESGESGVEDLPASASAPVSASSSDSGSRGDGESDGGSDGDDERTDSVLTGMIRRAGELGDRGHAGVIELLRAILEQPLPNCREVFEILGVDEPLYAFFPEIPRPRPEPSHDAHDMSDDFPARGPDFDLDVDADADVDIDADPDTADSSTFPAPSTSVSDTDLDADIDLGSESASESELDARLVERTTRVPRRPRHAVDDTRTPLLDRYGRDLTLLARKDSLPPLIGREQEMLSLARVLVRQRKANAVLVGEAGVGKTGIVEGLAARLAADGAPPDLTNARIVELTMSALVAGTKYRGEFEERMEAVLREARDTPGLILFLDELHTVLGAGAATGATDASGILKPMLARGEIRVIGATTAGEYHRHIEEDPALQRRFAVIWVEEPTRAEATEILKGVAGHIARHHRVEIAEDAPAAAIELAMRYLPDQHLPDKAIDLLDQACAAARIPTLPTPPTRDAVARDLMARDVMDRAAVARDLMPRDAVNRHATARDAAARDAATRDALARNVMARDAAAHDALARDAATHDLMARDAVPAPTFTPLPLPPSPSSSPSPSPIRVGRAEMVSVVAERARIPVARVALTEAQRLLDLEAHLSRRVIGQGPAVSAVSEAVRAARAGLGDPRRPIGVFLLAGPTGSGKTELAKALAEFLFDDEQRLIRIDMSEYQDRYTVSRLLGAPPGYLGHDREGQLSGPLRAHPHSVVLFDEVEKAHPEVLDLFLQILDEGRLTDARGRRVSFTETVVMMTTNLGYERGTEGTMGFRAQPRGADPMPSAGPARIMTELRRALRPELLGRVGNVVVFNPLPRPALEAVLTKLIARVHDRLADRALTLDLDRPARDLLLSEGTEPRSGARALEQTVERLLVQPLGRELLTGAFPDGSRIHVTVAPATTQALGETTTPHTSHTSGAPTPVLRFLLSCDVHALPSGSITRCETTCEENWPE